MTGVQTCALPIYDQTQPLIEYYKEQGILVTVDGTKELNEVFKDIVAVLGA